MPAWQRNMYSMVHLLPSFVSDIHGAEDKRKDSYCDPVTIVQVPEFLHHLS